MPIGSGGIGGSGVKATPGIKGPHKGFPWRSPAFSRLTPAGVTPIQTVDWTTTSSIPADLTFSRASGATYFDSSGVLQTASSNTARFDNKYNGTSWVPAGLLVEEQRTNSVTSQNVTTWSQFNMTVGSTVTGLDGASSAYPITPTAASGNHGVAQAGTLTVVNSSATFSAFIKVNGYTQVAFRESSTSGSTAVFNLSGAGSVAGTYNALAGVSASIISLGSGWYRISAVFTVSGSAPLSLGVFVTDGGWTSGDVAFYNFSGNTTSGVILFGAQMEAGTFPTSYIATAGSAVTRSADIVSSTDASLLAAQAWVMEVGELPGSTQATLVGINTGIGIGSTTGNALQTADGGTQTTGNTGTWTGVNRGGFAWDATPRVSIDLDGGTVVTAANTASTPTAIYFGNTNNGASDYLNGHIRSWGAYSALSNTDLVTISTVGASYSITAATTVSGVGTAAGVATVSGIGSSLAASAGAANGAATVSGVGASLAAGVGSANGAATVTATGVAAFLGVGSVSGAATVTATGAALFSAVGTATGAGTATGIGASLAASVGSSNGAATVTATGASLAKSAGTANGAATVTATGASLFAGVGNAAGAATVTATGKALFSGVGIAAGAATVTATGASLAAGVGNASGVATVSGVGASTTAGTGVGTVNGVATVTATGKSVVNAVGIAAGAAAVTATGNALFNAVGSAAGTSTDAATGSSLANGIGSAAGSATILGVAASAASIGTAVGTSVVTGVGSSIIGKIKVWHLATRGDLTIQTNWKIGNTAIGDIPAVSPAQSIYSDQTPDIYQVGDIYSETAQNVWKVASRGDLSVQTVWKVAR